MEKIELKYRILLLMKENSSMQPDALEGDRSVNENAIFELENEGLVKITGNDSSRYGKIILFTLTNKGVIKRNKLQEELSEPKMKKFGKWSVKILKYLSQHIVKIIVGAIIAALGSLLYAYLQNN